MLPTATRTRKLLRVGDLLGGRLEGIGLERLGLPEELLRCDLQVTVCAMHASSVGRAGVEAQQ